MSVINEADRAVKNDVITKVGITNLITIFDKIHRPCVVRNKKVKHKIAQVTWLENALLQF